MGTDATLRPKEDLPVKPESQPGSSEPSATEFNDWDKGRFINALGDKNAIIKDQKAKLEAYEKAEAKRKQEEADRKLADMSEAERLKTVAEQTAKENFQLKMKMFVTDELAKRKLNGNPIAEIAVETPWAIPAVKKHLGESPTWSETEVAVKQYLPAYLDSLVQNPPSNEPSPAPQPAPSTPHDTERPGQQPVADNTRIWSRREIGKMDAPTYKKYEYQILKAMAEGRITD